MGIAQLFALHVNTINSGGSIFQKYGNNEANFS